MKRLLLASYAFSPSIGGLETIGMTLARGLATDYDVTVITDSPDDGTDVGASPFRVVRKPSFWQLLAESRRADLVLQNHLSLRLGLLALLLNRPTVVTLQTWLDQSRPSTRLLQQWTLNRAVATITCSKAVADTLTKRPTVIHNSYNNHTFVNLNRPDRKGIAFVGRLVSDKGVMVLLQAFCAVTAQRAEAGPLHIIGDGPLLPEAVAYVAHHGLEARVTFHGSQAPENVNEILNGVRVQVIPSTWAEPFGIVALEGLAAGCHVISTTSGGLPEAAGPSATLIAANNVTALRDAIMAELHEPSSTSGSDVAAHLAEHEDTVLLEAYRSVLERDVRQRE